MTRFAIAIFINGILLTCARADDTVQTPTAAIAQIPKEKTSPAVEPIRPGFWSPAISTGGRSLQTGAKAISTITLAANDRLFVAGSDDRLLIWNTAKWKRLDDLATGYQVWSVASSPNSAQVAIGGSDGKLEVIDVEQQNQRFELLGHTTAVYRVVFSPDGSQLASAGADGTVRLWNIPQRKLTQEIEADRAAICALSFSPDGKLLGIRSQGETLLLWNISTAKAVFRLTEQGLNARTIAFSPDGSRFVTSSGGTSFVMRESPSGRELFTRETPWAEFFWHKRSDHMYVIGTAEISLYDSHSGMAKATARLTDGWIKAIAVTAEGRTLASLAGDSAIVVHDLSAEGWFTRQVTPPVPREASVDGRYSRPLRVLPAPGAAVIHGAFHEAGYLPKAEHPEFGSTPEGFYVFAKPNWYVFERSRLGLHHPPAKLPQPVKLPTGQSRIWIVLPSAGFCRGACEEAVAELPRLVKSIQWTVIHRKHSLPRPDKIPNVYRPGILQVTMDSAMTTEGLLQALCSQRFDLSESVVLGETEAKVANVYSGSAP